MIRLIVLFFFTGVFNLSAQDFNLANQYYSNGEYEKAAVIFGQIIDSKPENEYALNRYVESMMYIEKYEECIEVIKKLIKKNPKSGNLYVQYGNLLIRQGKQEEGDEQYEKAISTLSPDYNSVTRLANLFTQNNKFDLANRTYEKGSQLLGEKDMFAFSQGEVYRRMGNTEKMIEYYLNSLQSPSSSVGVQTITNYLARFLAPEEMPILQTQLYARLQQTETPELIELLAWSFIQAKDYKNALRQVRALDQRNNESGQRVFNLAREAAEDRDYDAAIAAFDYIITEKGPNNGFFFQAKQGIMINRRKKITEGYAYTPQELTALENDYKEFIGNFGLNRQTVHIAIEQAELEALYINDLPNAISLLDTLVKTPGLSREDRARAKINLADYYLMMGERWESTLLYSQVDKDFKEEVIGQEARFKNAKLAYFNGDFQWAQAQFDVLKASTSKLISNDALDLSVFIMDNLNLDTTADAITLYAGAELLVFQNRFEEAVARLDTLQRNFPEHSLQDDIFYLQAQIAAKKGEFEKAAELYKKVAEKFPEDIRADNALFALARLYETRLNDLVKAQELYEKIFNDYSGSVFAVEARKRYRLLRGDKVQ